MSCRVEWTPSGTFSIKRIHWRDAGSVDEAVQRYAATGEGEAFRLPDDPVTTVRLRVGSYRVLATLDPWDGVMRVWYVYRV